VGREGTILANILFSCIWSSQFRPKKVFSESELKIKPERMDESEERPKTVDGPEERPKIVDGPEETPETRVGHRERSDSRAGAQNPSTPTSHPRILRSNTIASRKSQTNLRNAGGGELDEIE
jgi:hypothetical protein